eukprot:759110-Hanusia_phi.AAC.4
MLSRMRRRSAAEEEERRGSEGDEHAWRFSCDQDSRILIEVAAHFASIYTLLVELYAVTFDVRPLAVWVIVLSCLADAILSVDFIASFFTSYWWLSGEGVWKQEFDLSRIARRNLTGSFVVDVWSIFPAQLLLKVVDPLGIMEDPGITIIRVFEVFKCLRSLRAFKQINTFQHATVIQSKLVESLSAVLLFLLLCHTLACVWFWFAKEEANGSSTSFFNRDTCSNRWEEVVVVVRTAATCMCEGVVGRRGVSMDVKEEGLTDGYLLQTGAPVLDAEHTILLCALVGSADDDYSGE